MGQIFRPGVAPSTIINPVNVTGAEPRVIFTETDAPGGTGNWDFQGDAGNFSLRRLDGAGSTAMLAVPNGASGVNLFLTATDVDGSFSQLQLVPGSVNLQGRNAITANTNGGDCNVFSGNGNGTGQGGDFALLAGAGGATGNGGPCSVSAGAGGFVSGNGGSLTLLAGLPTDGNGGLVSIQARPGVGTNRNGGNATLTAGNATGTGTGGNVTLTAGNSPSGTEGQVIIQSQGGNIRLDANQGQIRFEDGDPGAYTVGRGFRVAEGANAKQGTAVLVAGTVTVANTSVTANSRIFVTSNVDGGVPGFLRITAIVAATSFTITSSNAGDTSTVTWEIFEPAA